VAHLEDVRHPEPANPPRPPTQLASAAEPKEIGAERLAVLDLLAAIEYLHVPGACLGALFEGNEDLSRHQDLAYGLQLAVYETCANIVVHSYQICETKTGDPESCRINVAFTVAQQPLRLVIDLYDTGCSFDITRVPEPDIVEPQARGYGLYLIRQLVDEVVYEIQEHRNHWRLTKFL
jgi:serine/threonine-protein kinase RsbW